MNGNGIKITLKTDAVVENVYVATVRRCPALLGILKKLNKAQTQQATAARRSELLSQKIAEASLEELDALEKAIDKAADVQAALGTSMYAALEEFFVVALMGSGLYKKAEAERFASFIPMIEFGKIQDAILTGQGALDFSRTAGTAKKAKSKPAARPQK
ncbi:MAG: hypothetical protein GY851_35750 [bacterium]|nr:hypothetical protein [bacterium]